jgi:hypothetical protein
MPIIDVGRMKMRSHERVEAGSLARNLMVGAPVSVALVTISAGVQAQIAAISGDGGTPCFGTCQTARRMTGCRTTKRLGVWTRWWTASVRPARAAWATAQNLDLQDGFRQWNF